MAEYVKVRRRGGGQWCGHTQTHTHTKERTLLGKLAAPLAWHPAPDLQCPPAPNRCESVVATAKAQRKVS